MTRLRWCIRVAICVRLLAWVARAWPDENPRVGAALLALINEISEAIACERSAPRPTDFDGGQ